MVKTVAFTGPRPEKLPAACAGGDIAAIAKLGDVIEEQIYLLLNRGYTRFFSGMSRGVDLIAAERALALRNRGAAIEIVAAVPYRGQSAEWGTEDRAEHARILALCDERVILAEHFEPRCYSRRNRYMVEQADLLLAVYDGQSGGGTENTLGYATQKGIPIILINPETCTVTELIRE